MFKKSTIKSKQFVRKRGKSSSSDDEGFFVLKIASNSMKIGKTKKNSEEISVSYKSRPEKAETQQNAMEQPRNVIRTTTQYDYQPDVCKDYKETGYCGFGDSCKFLHDRSDYKFGWQLNNVKDDAADNEKFEIHSDHEDSPSTCPICHEEFAVPVITRCKHQFCEKCALENFKKSTRCFVCDTPTGGIFNVTRNSLQHVMATEN